MANWGTVPGQVGDRLRDATTVDSLPFLERPFVGKDVCLSAKPVRICYIRDEVAPSGPSEQVALAIYRGHEIVNNLM